MDLMMSQHPEDDLLQSHSEKFLEMAFAVDDAAKARRALPKAELAGIGTAIILAARSGSSIAAELGTMVVTEEVDALKAKDQAEKAKEHLREWVGFRWVDHLPAWPFINRRVLFP